MRLHSLYSFCLLSFVVAVPVWAQNAPRTYDFNTPPAAPFAFPYAAPGGVTAKVDIAVKNGALQFTNRAGGSFGVKLDVPAFDAAQYPVFAFDYTRTADAKVNFFFKVNNAYYGVVFSGPARVRPGSFLLGQVPNVGAKGRAVLPLRDWLRAYLPKADELQVSEILVGNWDNQGYLLAGIGGNGPGATWTMDNLTLTPVTNSALRMGTPAFEGNRLVWPLQSGAALDTKSATLSVDERKFDFDSPFLRYETSVSGEAPKSRVVLEAGDAGLNFRNGQSLNLQLNDQKTTVNFNQGNQAVPVPLPRLRWGDLQAPSADFEMDSDGFKGGESILVRDDEDPHSGATSLQWFNRRTASSFDGTLSGQLVDVAKFPVLTFYYRTDSRVRADLRLMWDGKAYSVQLFDRDADQPRLGSIAEVTADEKWHLAVVPLLEWMKKTRPDAQSFQITDLSFGDSGWKGNARAVHWFLDDFRFAPQFSGKATAQVSLRDVSGVGKVAYQLDQNPETTIGTDSQGGAQIEIPLEGKAAGLYWLHVRASNGAGRWSETAHFPVVVG